MFKNRVLRRIFGDKRDEVTGEWRKLHNEELNDPYCSPNIVWAIKSMIMRWAGYVNAYSVLVGKPDGKRPLGRPRHRCEDDINMDVQKVGCGGYELVRAGLVQGQVCGHL
jgi:hypothetical protein